MDEAIPDGLQLFSGPDAPKEEDMYKCVHCGFCLQACPTYLETGLETESPRGRIALMKAVNERRIGFTPTVFQHWDLCIQCRACEVACPSGVPYGRLIESTMAQVQKHRKSGLISGFAARMLLKKILPSQRMLLLLVSCLKLYKMTGVRWLVRKSHMLKLLSKRLASLEESTPQINGNRFKTNDRVIIPEGNLRAKVALLSGCIMPLVNGPEMEAMVRVLVRNGCEVVVPRNQGCCGAINSHVGDLDTARMLARKNVDIFLGLDIDTLVVGSAGCGSRMKEYGDLLRHDTLYSERAERLSLMVKDIHEFLVELPMVPPSGNAKYRVTLQESCHLAHAQRITEAPIQILRSIPGVELVEMEDSSKCCGAGGTYTITQRDFSLRLLDSKMSVVKGASPDVLATMNPGCYMQLQYGVQRANMNTSVKYVTDLLDEAYA